MEIQDTITQADTLVEISKAKLDSLITMAATEAAKEGGPDTLDFIKNVIAIIASLLAATLSYYAYRYKMVVAKLGDEIDHLKKVNFSISSKVNPESDRQLIKEATVSIQILGINSLRVFHHSREELINFLLSKRGTIQVLLMDPEKKEFEDRVTFEQDEVGRIKSEWEATRSILEEIALNAKNRGSLQLKLYNLPPDRSLVIVDGLSKFGDKGRMLVNIYPKETGERGYVGGQFLIEESLMRDRDSFERNMARFEELWQDAESRSLTN